MEAEYKHTQFGALTLAVLFLADILTAYIILPMLADGRLAVAFVTLGLYIFIVALFYAFTVEISDGKLNFWFGIRFISKSYSLEEIQSTQEVENPWYYLWGIKSIPGGWLYAIGPGGAVELVFKNGKIIRLGSNQPEKLKQAIDNVITAA